MTKITKKSNKKAFLFIALAIAIIAVLSFGATYALFTAETKTVTGSLTTGHLKLTSDGSVTFTTHLANVMPEDDILPANQKFVVDVGDDRGAYVGMIFKIELTGVQASDAGLDKITESLQSWGWYSIDENKYIYGTNAETPTKITTKGAEERDGAGTGDVVINTEALKFKATGHYVEGSTQPAIMGASITITIQGFAVQGANVESADALTQLKTLLSVE